MHAKHFTKPSNPSEAHRQSPLRKGRKPNLSMQVGPGSLNLQEEEKEKLSRSSNSDYRKARKLLKVPKANI